MCLGALLCLSFSLTVKAKIRSKIPRPRAMLVNFPSKHIQKLEDGLKTVRRKVEKCAYFQQFYRSTRDRLIKILKKYQFSIKYRGKAPREGSCGYTYPLFRPSSMYIYEDAFDAKCFYVRNVLFHEFIHLANRRLSESEVEKIEVRCIGIN